MRIIGVVSGKGGVGKTTLVANLGVALASFGKSTTIVDCNITTSHLGFSFGFYYYPVTLNNVLRGEATLLDATYSHSSGVKIVPASLAVDDLIGVEIERLEHILRFEDVDIVLLDSAPGLGREALSVLNTCNEVIFVTVPYLNAISDIIRCSVVTNQLKIKPLGIVLNMVREDPHELTVSQIEELTKLPVISKIPYDINVQRSLAAGTPILTYKPNSEASIAIMKLAAELIGQAYVPRKSIFSRIYEFFKRL